ncbi:class I SAM-dependent methyltransferase [Nonomuraea pusilla]|uniref:Methyltransferase domain-containing protein n=1 Tax=Nonomuraea pusilla TaxID=46177 RepID=A0A1H7SEW1_9ACTN|nr:class I SAM-dependent methyltransferase [Nonomuraea pusilla]SEL70849.1 Methyltransferase domain-containing protein [Nonomuraea pusilla]
MTNDNYSLAVPFYDLWHEDGHVPQIRAGLPALIKDVSDGVLEIGAGTGLVTEVIARETEGEVFAVEPSLGMRSVLLSRLAADAELRSRVTVLPYGALDVDLDEPVGAVVMISVLHAFTPAGRERLWPTLARQLRPGGLLVLNHRERPAPRPGEPERLASYRVGRHAYEIWGQTLEVDGETVRSRFLYRIRQRGVVISEDEVVSVYHGVTGARLAAEVEAAGFVPESAPEGLRAWRRSAS